MNLSAPTQIVFIICLVLALVAVIASMGIVPLPIPAFWLMTAAFILLALACVLTSL